MTIDWSGPRYEVAAIIAFGVVAIKLSWPYVARGIYRAGFWVGRLTRDIAARKKPS